MDGIVLLVIFLLTAGIGLRKNSPKMPKRILVPSDTLSNGQRPTIDCKKSDIIRKNHPVRKTQYVQAKAVVHPSVMVHLKAASEKFIKKQTGVYANEMEKASGQAITGLQKACHDANLVVNTKVKTKLQPSINIFSPVKVCAEAQGVAIVYD